MLFLQGRHADEQPNLQGDNTHRRCILSSQWFWHPDGRPADAAGARCRVVPLRLTGTPCTASRWERPTYLKNNGSCELHTCLGTPSVGYPACLEKIGTRAVQQALQNAAERARFAVVPVPCRCPLHSRPVPPPLPSSPGRELMCLRCNLLIVHCRASQHLHPLLASADSETQKPVPAYTWVERVTKKGWQNEVPVRHEC